MVTCLIDLKKASNLAGTGKPKREPEKIRSTTKEADSFTEIVRIFFRTLLLASLLQTQTSCCYGCGGDQVTWRSANAAKNDTCLPCIDCPDGMEPSIRCGGVAKHGTDLHCVACKVGMYSDSYGKEQCRPCSLCSDGRSVKLNCSASQNRLCGSCNYGYYKNDVVSSCLPCSICCWDGKDQLESQCIEQGLPSHRHCKPRHKDGCELSTTATKESTRPQGRIVITSPTTMKRKIQTRKTTTSRISVTVQDDSTKIQSNKSTTPFQSVSTATEQLGEEIIKRKPTPQTALTRHPRGRNQENTASTHLTTRVVSYGKARRSVKESSENERRIIIAVVVSMVALILLAVIFKRNTVAPYLRWMKCRPVCRFRDSELGEGTESSSLDESRSPVGVVPYINGLQGVLSPLNTLKSLSLDAYEKVWKRLDKRPEGTNKGDFKTVAVEFGFEEENIWELEKEFKTSGSGSPSRQLLEALETRRPKLTVFEFIIVMKKPNIGRDDIADILQDYLFK